MIQSEVFAKIDNVTLANIDNAYILQSSTSENSASDSTSSTTITSGITEDDVNKLKTNLKNSINEYYFDNVSTISEQVMAVLRGAISSLSMALMEYENDEALGIVKTAKECTREMIESRLATWECLDDWVSKIEFETKGSKYSLSETQSGIDEIVEQIKTFRSTESDKLEAFADTYWSDSNRVGFKGMIDSRGAVLSIPDKTSVTTKIYQGGYIGELIEDYNFDVPMPSFWDDINGSKETYSIEIPKVSGNVSEYTITITLGKYGTMPSGYTSGITTDSKTDATTLENVPYGATIEIEWSVKEGYTFSDDSHISIITSKSTYKVHKTTSIYSFSQPTTQLLYPMLSIGTPTDESYTVTCNVNPTYGGTFETQSDITNAGIFYLPYGSTATISYKADTKTGYATTVSDTVTKLMTSTQMVEPSTSKRSLIYYQLSVGATTGQTYKVTGVTNPTFGGTLPTTDTNGTTDGIATSRNTTGTFLFPYGATATITYIADKQTVKYIYTATDAVTKTMTSDQTVDATDAIATLRSYPFTITQSDHETITVTTSRGTYTETFDAFYGDTWTASVVADKNYLAGTLSSTSGTIRGKAEVSVTKAIRTYVITIKQSTHETITVKTNRGTYTETFIAQEGDTWTATASADNGYILGTLSATSGAANSDTTISITNAIEIVMQRVGGTIFHIGNANNVKYTFYNEDKSIISDVKVGDTPYYYAIDGVPTTDKYYVYHPQMDSNNYYWTYVNNDIGKYEVTNASGTAIGTGKGNTTTVMANTAYNTTTQYATLWYYISQINTNKVGGRSDWYIGSKDEIEALRNSGLNAKWFTNYYIWSSSESDDDEAWLWYCYNNEWDDVEKNYGFKAIAMRSF